MPKTPMLSTTPHLPAHLPALRTAPETKPNVRLLPAEHAEALLRDLVKLRWARLLPHDDDPLATLFSNQARQWTLGWHPETGDLFLLIWETPSWQEKPRFLLYENGELIFQDTEGASKPRTQLLQKLLESEQLPFIGISAFLEPLGHFRFQPAQREDAGRAVLATMLARSEVAEFLKEPLFQLLEAELDTPDWPLLEVMKLYRLAHKNVLVRLFKSMVQTGFIRTLRDNARLDRALTLLQEDYFQYGYKVPQAFRPAYDQSCDEFRALIMDGSWRVKLRWKLPPGKTAPLPG